MSAAPVLLYVVLENGRCGLTTDSRTEVLRKQGTFNVQHIRPATEKDVAWVQGMGGAVPESYRLKARQS
jgi:hypothetical protein